MIEQMKTGSFRLLSELYSLLCTVFPVLLTILVIVICFRLLSELYSLLYINSKNLIVKKLLIMFPSPLGVIFSLIFKDKKLKELEDEHVSVSSRSYILSYQNIVITLLKIILIYQFPSPLGVIFSLIEKIRNFKKENI